MGFRLAAFADEAGPSVEEQIRALREERIPLVELRGVDGRGADTLSEQEAAALRVRLEDALSQSWSLGSPFGKTGIREPFGPAFDAFRRGLDVARALGTAHLRCSASNPRRRRPARVPRRGYGAAHALRGGRARQRRHALP